MFTQRLLSLARILRKKYAGSAAQATSRCECFYLLVLSSYQFTLLSFAVEGGLFLE